MLKKSLIFVSAALFLVALITLTGCPTSVDDGSSGTVYAHRIYGTAVSPYVAQEAINRAVAAGEPIVLEDGLELNAGHLNFKNAQVRIGGVVTMAATGVISVADASVTWADNARLIFAAPGTGAFIHRLGQDTTRVAAANLVEYADSLDTIMPTATAAAVRQFKLGAKQDHDYSTDSNGVSARIKASGLATLYILDELIISSDATIPSAVTITAMGTVDVIGTPPASVIVGGPAGTPKLPLGTSSTLTTSKGGVVVTVPAAPTIPNIKVDEGKDFIIAQDGTAGVLTIDGKLTGKGTLEVTTAPTTTITIKGGDGNVRFSAATHTATGLAIDSTGTTTFDSNLNTISAVSNIAGNAVFGGDLTLLTDAGLTLSGDVTLTSGKKVTLVSGKTLTLGAGKTVSVRFTPRGQAPVIAPVLIAGPADVVLTPGGATTLTAADNPTQTSETAIANAKRLTLGVAPLTITDGTLGVVPGASLAIDGFALNTGIAVVGTPRIGYLAVEDGGTLVLAGAGSIDIGATVINGASTLKASGGTITLGNDKIAGSVYGAVLTGASGAPLFTQTGPTSLLTLEQADLNLAAYGRLTIGTAGARVILTERGKITLNNGEDGVPTTRSKIGTATLSGGFVGLTSPTATTTQQVWSVAHKDAAAADVSITATASIELAKSGTTFSAN